MSDDGNDAPKDLPQNLESLQAAKHVYEETRYLLDDQIAYASALKDQRRTSAVLLAVLVGVGVFRIDLYRSPDQVPAIPPLDMAIVLGCFLSATLCVFVGTYYLFTERSIGVELAKPRTGTASALSALFLPQQALEECLETKPADVYRLGINNLRLAYQRLRDANRRVRRRMAIGLCFVLLGLAFVILAFAVFAIGAGWTILAFGSLAVVSGGIIWRRGGNADDRQRATN